MLELTKLKPAAATKFSPVGGAAGPIMHRHFEDQEKL